MRPLVQLLVHLCEALRLGQAALAQRRLQLFPPLQQHFLPALQPAAPPQLFTQRLLQLRQLRPQRFDGPNLHTQRGSCENA